MPKAQSAYYSGNAEMIDQVLRRAARTSLLQRGPKRNALPIRKRVKTATKTRTVQKRKKATDYGQQNQLSRQSYNAGRKPKLTVSYLNGLIKTNQSYSVYRFGGINPFAAGQGFFKLNYGPITGGIGNLPCHMYDITSVINFTANAAATALPGYQALLSGITNNITSFSQLSQQSADGATLTSGWTHEHFSAGNTGGPTGYPGKASVMDWFQARFVLYGARNRPVKYLIQLVQFLDDDNAPTAAANNKRTNLFNALLKPFTYNPIADVDTAVAKRVKVLKAWTHLIQPDTSTNLDTAPLQKEFNVFMRMNRKCKFDWADRSVVNNSLNAYNEADYLDQNLSVNTSDVHEYVIPRARVYLMIRAMATTSAAAFDPLIHPSYDMKIRTRHTFGT